MVDVALDVRFEPRFREPRARGPAGAESRLLRLLVGDASGARSELSVPYDRRCEFPVLHHSVMSLESFLCPVTGGASFTALQFRNEFGELSVHYDRRCEFLIPYHSVNEFGELSAPCEQQCECPTLCLMGNTNRMGHFGCACPVGSGVAILLCIDNAAIQYHSLEKESTVHFLIRSCQAIGAGGASASKCQQSRCTLGQKWQY